MDYSELGQQLAAFRPQQKITQQEMADHIGITRATINALENGRSGDVGVRKVLKILDYLGYQIVLKKKSAFPTLEELRDE